MIGTRLVPMSELLSAEATLTRTCFVFDLCLDPISAELQVATVACHVGGLGMIDRGLVILLNLSRLSFPTHLVEDATIGDDLSFECVVDSFDL